MKSLAGWIVAIPFLLGSVTALAAGEQIRVRVVDAATGKPVAGALGRLKLSDGERIDASPNGEVRFDVSTPVEVWAEAPGYLTGSIRVDAPTKKVLTIPLQKAHTLRGVVTGAAGKGLAGIEVYAEHTENDAWSARAVTDSAGRFLLTRVGPGRNRVSFARDSVHVVRHVEVPAKEPLRVEWSDSVLRVSVRSGDRPVPDARVRIEEPRRRESSTRTTDADGVAVFELEDRNRVWVQVSAPGFAPAPPRQVEIDRAQVELTIALAPGLTIRGRVVDPLGNPITGAKIGGKVYSPPTEPKWPSPEEVESDAEGRFTLRDLADLRYTLRAEHPAYAAGEDVEARPGEGEVRLVLPRCGTVTGRLVMGGRPVRDFIVHSRYVGDSEGRFRVACLAPGETRLFFEGRFVPFTMNVRVEPGGELALGDIEVSPADELEVSVLQDARPTPEFTVSVTAAGERVPDDPSEWGTRARSRETGSDGRILFDDLPPGRYVVIGIGEAGRAGPFEVVVEGGARAKLALQVQPAGIVEGVVRDEFGKPLTGIAVFVLNDDNFRMTQSGPDGVFRVSGLETGTYWVQAFDRERALAAIENPKPDELGEPIEVKAGSIVRRDLTLGSAVLERGER